MLSKEQMRMMSGFFTLLGGFSFVGALTLVSVLAEGLSGNVEYAEVYFLTIGAFVLGCVVSYFTVRRIVKKIQSDAQKMMESFDDDE